MGAARVRKPRRTTAVVKVDNPAFSTSLPEGMSNPRTIDAVVSLRESSITTLAAHGVLDADQWAAAKRFGRVWETVSAIRPAVLEPDHIRGGEGDGIAERQINAATDLRIARDLLGRRGFELVSRICGDGYHIRDLYQDRRRRDTATDMLKAHLTDLAEIWR